MSQALFETTAQAGELAALSAPLSAPVLAEVAAGLYLLGRNGRYWHYAANN